MKFVQHIVHKLRIFSKKKIIRKKKDIPPYMFIKKGVKSLVPLCELSLSVTRCWEMAVKIMDNIFWGRLFYYVHGKYRWCYISSVVYLYIYRCIFFRYFLCSVSILLYFLFSVNMFFFVFSLFCEYFLLYF